MILQLWCCGAEAWATTASVGSVGNWWQYAAFWWSRPSLSTIIVITFLFTFFCFILVQPDSLQLPAPFQEQILFCYFLAATVEASSNPYQKSSFSRCLQTVHRWPECYGDWQCAVRNARIHLQVRDLGEVKTITIKESLLVRIDRWLEMDYWYGAYDIKPQSSPRFSSSHGRQNFACSIRNPGN